jgi:hypothetical protein
MKYEIKRKDKFLYLPKKIHGKWFWLRKITEIVTTQRCVVNGEVQSIIIKKEYYL